MECGEHDGRCASMASDVGLQLQLGLGGVAVAGGGRLLGGAARTAGPPRRAPAPAAPPRRAPAPAAPLALDAPFMSDMDEISYWISTKRAPCLMNYDRLVRKQSEEAQCSTTVPEVPPPPRKKKKKRKLSVLDEDSVSTEKPQNVFFEVPSKRILPATVTPKTESVGSDVDFNITATTVAEKNKKGKLKKNIRGKLHKKNKLVTSTPKASATLRRSLRRAQHTEHSTRLDTSYEMFNASVVSNGHFKIGKLSDKVNHSTQMFAVEDCDSINKRDTTTRNQKSKTAIQSNGQFEDLSDVSGFTANYIRSTKVQSSKTPKKLRCKSSSRPLGRDSQPNSSQEPLTSGNMVLCLNKSTNTGIPPNNMLNCSTDSSQNIINLVTTRSHNRSTKMDKSTSLLKFVDVKGGNREASGEQAENKQKKMNISFQSQSSAASRYPKRYKNHTDAVVVNETNVRTRASRRNCLEYNNLNKKENPEESVVSRARGVAASVLVVSNCTEAASSPASVNVARRGRARAAPRRSGRPRRAPPDASRDRTGFTACFSDSDDDSAPLSHRKYFCK